MHPSTFLPLALLTSISLLAGCSLAVLSLEAPGGNAALSVSPRIQDGGYATQAVVRPYMGADVDHVVLTLNTVAGSTETQIAIADLPKADLARGIVFGKLRPDLTYRIKAKAYKAAGSDPSDLISVDASSSVDVSVGREDSHDITLPVQLAARDFSATGLIPGVAVTEGQFTASGSVTVTASPAPTPTPGPI